MPFPLPLALAIYATIWWIVLFMVLPLGVRSVEEAGEERPDGADPGAPLAPQLAKKAGLTRSSQPLFLFASPSPQNLYLDDKAVSWAGVDHSHPGR
ncbi:MAG: DUF1467 family protein [Methylocystis sp.]